MATFNSLVPIDYTSITLRRTKVCDMNDILEVSVQKESQSIRVASLGLWHQAMYKVRAVLR